MKTIKNTNMKLPLTSLMMLVVVGLVIANTADKAVAETSAKQVSMTAKILPATDKLPARLSITAAIDEGWHIYSVTQAKGGPRPTKFKLEESEDFKLSGDFTADPAPVVHVYEDIWPDLNVEEHTGNVTWTAPLELGSGVDAASLTIEVNAKGQVCNEEVCNNFKATLSAATD